MKKIRINFEKFSDGILIPQFPWPNRQKIVCLDSPYVLVCAHTNFPVRPCSIVKLTYI